MTIEQAIEWADKRLSVTDTGNDALDILAAEVRRLREVCAQEKERGDHWNRARQYAMESAELMMAERDELRAFFGQVSLEVMPEDDNKPVEDVLLALKQLVDDNKKHIRQTWVLGEELLQLRDRLKAAEEVMEAYKDYLQSIATFPKPTDVDCNCSGCTLLAALAKYEQIGRK